MCTHTRMCVCPITLSVSVLCIFSFLYWQAFIWCWLDWIFNFDLCRSYTDTVCKAANCYVFHDTVMFTRGRGHHRFDLWPVGRPAAVEEDGREGQGWLVGEGERGVDLTKSWLFWHVSMPLPLHTHTVRTPSPPPPPSPFLHTKQIGILY